MTEEGKYYSGEPLEENEDTRMGDENEDARIESMRRLALLEEFFAAVADATVNHATFTSPDGEDYAVVYPKRLGELLEKVDPEWYENLYKMTIIRDEMTVPAEVKAICIKYKTLIDEANNTQDEAQEDALDTECAQLDTQLESLGWEYDYTKEYTYKIGTKTAVPVSAFVL